MLPLWRDEVSIYLGPRKIALARRVRGLKAAFASAVEMAVPGGSIAESGPVFARLAEALRDSMWQDAAARVVVADPWVRFSVMPSPPAHLDADQRKVHARYVLEDSYGTGITDWHMVLEDAPPGCSCVACAMPDGLQASLLAVLAPARLQLKSMQAQLVVAYNAWRDRLPADDAWFVTLEDGWLSAVHLSHGAWDRVHTARLSGDPAIELARLQAFGRLTAGGRMFVEAPAGLRQRARRMGAEFEWLELDPAEETVQSHELALLTRSLT